MTITIDRVLRVKLTEDAAKLERSLRHKRYQRVDAVIALQNIDLAIEADERELHAIAKALS